MYKMFIVSNQYNTTHKNLIILDKKENSDILINVPNYSF